MISNNTFEKWIFDSYSPGANGLALYRIFASLFYLFFLLPDFEFYLTLASFPTDFFSPPPGPMMLLEDFPPAWILQLIHVLLILSWVCVLLGFKTKKASITAGIFMMILQGFMFSLGKVNHEILLSVTPMLMAFSNWGVAFSFDSLKHKESKKTEGWPLVLLALFIGFMMFSAGLPKILGGWLDPSTQATKGHLLNQYFVRGRQDLLAHIAIQIDAAWLWEFLDWATIFFEIGFLIAVLKAKWFRLFVCFAVLFHFSTMMTLNIAFLSNFMAYAAFFKWDNLYQYMGKKYLDGHSQTQSVSRVLFFAMSVFFFFAILKWASEAEILMSFREPSFHEVVLLSLFLMIVSILAIKKLRQISTSF